MFSTFTIIASAVLLLCAIAGVVMNVFLRVPLKSATQTAEGDSSPKEPLSIIVMVGDDGDLLQRNLPLYLDQDYDAGYQLIFVADEKDPVVEAIMNNNEQNCKLKSTFIPQTTRYISRAKLGITLGVKAADHEWCILINARTYPTSRHWLSEMGRACTHDKNIVLGYTNYAKASSWKKFRRLQMFAYLWRECNKGILYAANSANIAFRKSEFINGDGYRGNLESIHGEYDFIANKYARKNSAAAVCHCDAMMLETEPTKKQWKVETLSRIHSMRFMLRTKKHHLWPFFDIVSLHLATLLLIAGIATSAITNDIIILSVSLLSTILFVTGRIVITNKALKAMQCNMGAWKILPFEIWSAYHSIITRLRYRTASKYDFTCHKL